MERLSRRRIEIRRARAEIGEIAGWERQRRVEGRRGEERRREGRRGERAERLAVGLGAAGYEYEIWESRGEARTARTARTAQITDLICRCEIRWRCRVWRGGGGGGKGITSSRRLRGGV